MKVEEDCWDSLSSHPLVFSSVLV